MTTVYLVRHGQSVANEKDLFIGHTDMALTELGKAQAARTAEFFKDITVDAIYSSDLKRAYSTAKATAKVKGLAVTVKKELRDIFAGAWEAQAFSVLPKRYPEDYNLWLNDIDASRCTCGESVIEVKKRITAAILDIIEQNTNKTVIVFTHAMPIRALRSYFDNAPVKDIPWPTNASVSCLDVTTQAFTLYSHDSFLAHLVTALPENV